MDRSPPPSPVTSRARGPAPPLRLAGTPTSRQITLATARTRASAARRTAQRSPAKPRRRSALVNRLPGPARHLQAREPWSLPWNPDGSDGPSGSDFASFAACADALLELRKDSDAARQAAAGAMQREAAATKAKEEVEGALADAQQRFAAERRRRKARERDLESARGRVSDAESLAKEARAEAAAATQSLAEERELRGRERATTAALRTNGDALTMDRQRLERSLQEALRELERLRADNAALRADANRRMSSTPPLTPTPHAGTSAVLCIGPPPQPPAFAAAPPAEEGAVSPATAPAERPAEPAPAELLPSTAGCDPGDAGSLGQRGSVRDRAEVAQDAPTERRSLAQAEEPAVLSDAPAPAETADDAGAAVGPPAPPAAPAGTVGRPSDPAEAAGAGVSGGPPPESAAADTGGGPPAPAEITVADTSGGPPASEPPPNALAAEAPDSAADRRMTAEGAEAAASAAEVLAAKAEAASADPSGQPAASRDASRTGSVAAASAAAGGGGGGTASGSPRGSCAGTDFASASQRAAGALLPSEPAQKTSVSDLSAPQSLQDAASRPPESAAGSQPTLTPPGEPAEAAEDAGGPQAEAIDECLSPAGAPAGKPERTGGRVLWVRADRAESVLSAMSRGPSNPVLVLSAGSPELGWRELWRTQPVEKSYNPQWAEEAELTGVELPEGARLRFSVFHKSKWTDEEDWLGSCDADPADEAEEVRRLPMHPRPEPAHHDSDVRTDRRSQGFGHLYVVWRFRAT
eukprot:TRINITY_DN47621_c0_g1_i1.p1 TRINITY_DN47621_c0_g1~~TRINITY_DN47621_c0_g1_i1.p1  ORF type:complete len:754 (+),score=237.16 TRINITY_DN47621_c0_g1_i1:55-2316(+)